MMLGITTDSIARAIQAPYFGDSTTISGVAIDSRELQKVDPTHTWPRLYQLDPIVKIVIIAVDNG